MDAMTTDSPSRPRDLPLAGIRVLDLTRALSGPFCTMILADLGADVIKVEPTPGGDMIRQWGPFDEDISVYYLSANRNKRAMAVDFRHPAGLGVLRRLAGQVDVVVENFKPGTVDRLGLSYRQLAADDPRIICASISGFGQTGPAGQWPGFDQIAQGYGGLMSVTGEPDGEPIRVGVAIGDLTSGMWAALGIQAALIERQRTGRGQRVDTSLLASLVGLLSVQGQRFLSLGEVPARTGNAHPVIAPYGVFATADGPLNIGSATQDMWLRLCRLLGCAELIDDPRFADNAARAAHRVVLKELLEAKLKTRTRAQWTSALIEQGIPAGPINDLRDVFTDEQVLHEGMVETIRHPVLGELRQIGSPIGLGAHPGAVTRSPPPAFGEHTRELLAEFGWQPADIDRLIADEAVFQR
ncbi:MAG: CoA transferase [Burkholderiaceae bacterium]